MRHPPFYAHDLVVLVADPTMRDVIDTLLQERWLALGIRQTDHRVIVHPARDPGVVRNAADFLRPFLSDYAYALVLFDQQGCGRKAPRQELESLVEQALKTSGWAGRSKAICISPELENWVWSPSSRLHDALRCSPDGVRRILGAAGIEMDPQSGKPSDPKAALEAVLRDQDRPRSATLYKDIAKTVSLAHCVDPAFCDMREALCSWFSAGASGVHDE